MALAPFVSVSFGQFRDVTTTTAIAGGGMTTPNEQELAKTSWHEWIFIGVRAAFMP